MDEFAQSREDDDLFADEFEPVSEPAIVEEPQPQPQPVEQHEAPAPEKQGFNGTNNQREGRGQQQGRGRGGRGGGRGGAARAGAEQDANKGMSTSRWADSTAAPAAETLPAPSTQQPESTSTEQATQAPPAQQTPAPTEPKEARVHAVRGDRTLTGGPAKKKLTEEELTAKMAEMAILNAKKAERHRLSEADSAAFERREKEQQKKRVEEQKSRREMDMERAKNRERKLKAQGGREWDEGKEEEMFEDKRRSQYVRGGHGGVKRGGAGLAGSRYATQDNGGDESPELHSPPSGRGRGGFNIRGRGGATRGRGGHAQPGSPKVPAPEDFPSLPNAKGETVKSPVTPAGDWAEEMATPVEEKTPVIAS
ncbi:hypothetical protein BP6252_06603 [Coleophoma cylindrospora]|uniref:Uncharacterized protein n=1 Tax=Coleophoma cylindrospora TaxID=1849047 RepID=A0A3D8RNS6_9HELO|nr:hypothetical protein BP6252_06603 [Coleophoma cylindrospora]